MTDHYPALVFLAPFATAISMPLIGHRQRRLCRPVALAALSAMALLAILSLASVLTQGPVRYAFSGWAAPIGIEWVADPASATIVVALSALAALCLLYGGAIPDESLAGRTVPYHTTVLLLVAGLAGVSYAGDLFNIFVFLEVAALAAYALVAVAGGRALVSAFRYLIMGAIGATLYLLGVAFFYAATGSLNVADLAQRIPGLLDSRAVIGGLILMFIGLGIKMALMPLHGWVPDAYSDAPDATAPLLAGLLTKIAALVWVKILFAVTASGLEEPPGEIFALVGGLGMLAALGGSVLALGQQELKRMFVYGGVAHIGLVLIGAGQANLTGLAGGLYYLLNDAVIQCGLFMLAGVLAARHGVRSLDEAGRARIRDPWMLAPFVVISLGMIGLPPTGGFFGKWYILLGALEAGNHLAAGTIVATTLLTLAYFVRIFEKLFRKGEAEPAPARPDAPWALRISLAAPATAVILLGLGSDRIIAMLRSTASGLGL